MKHRNITLAVILKNDPKRLRDRTVETEPRKLVKNRTRRKLAAGKTYGYGPCKMCGAGAGERCRDLE